MVFSVFNAVSWSGWGDGLMEINILGRDFILGEWYLNG